VHSGTVVMHVYIERQYAVLKAVGVQHVGAWPTGYHVRWGGWAVCICTGAVGKAGRVGGARGNAVHHSSLSSPLSTSLSVAIH
jgi:hypothetical protein